MSIPLFILALSAALAAPGEPPCDAIARVDDGDVAWVVCDGRVLQGEDERWRSVKLASDGTPIGLFLRSGRVWVEVKEDGETVMIPAQAPVAVPAPEAAPATVPAPEPEPTPVSPAPTPLPPVLPTVAAAPGERRGQVVGFEKRRPIIDLGTNDGLALGTTVEFYEIVVRQVAGEDIRHEKRRALGVVRAVGDTASEVQLGLNQYVETGSPARVTDAPRRTGFLAPPRIGNVGNASLDLLGLVSLSDDAGGVVVRANVGYRFKAPIAIELDLSPTWFIGSATGGGSAVDVGVAALVSFDHRLFAVGVGGGVASGSRFGGGTAGIFAQKVRFGATDGLNFTSRIKFSKGTSQVWYMDSLDADFQIPLTAGPTPTWMLIYAGGGAAPSGSHAHGGLAARFRVIGDGRRGTLALTPMVGFESVNVDDGDTYYNFIGPSFGLRTEAAF